MRATYRQWANFDAQIRSGEKSGLVIFCKEFEPDPEDKKSHGKRQVACSASARTRAPTIRCISLTG